MLHHHLFLRATASLRPSLLSSSSTSALLITRPLTTSTRAAALPSPSLLFRRTARPLTVALGVALPFVAASRPTLNDSSPALGEAGFSSSAPDLGGKKDVPVFKNGNLNPAAVKQISLGGMLGLGAGVLLSMLSRVLVLAVGVGIVVWQVSDFRSSVRLHSSELVVSKSEQENQFLLIQST